jgi:hypothetical protein
LAIRPRRYQIVGLRSWLLPFYLTARLYRVQLRVRQKLSLGVFRGLSFAPRNTRSIGVEGFLQVLPISITCPLFIERILPETRYFCQRSPIPTYFHFVELGHFLARDTRSLRGYVSWGSASSLSTSIGTSSNGGISSKLRRPKCCRNSKVVP